MLQDLFRACVRLLCASLLLATIMGGWSAASEARTLADCSTPRRATMTLINYLQPDRYQPDVAAACFDFSRFSGVQADREKVAKDFKAVLDARGLFVYEDRIPDEANYTDSQSNQALFFLFPRELPHSGLHKVKNQWLFTPETVRDTPNLYHETFALGVEQFARKLPVFFQGRLFGVHYWQVLLLGLVLVFSLIVGRLVGKLLVSAATRLLTKQEVGWVDELERMSGPLAALISAGFLGPVIPELGLTVKFSVVLLVAVKVVATGAVVIVAYRMIDVLSGYMGRKASATDTRLDDQLVPLVRKSLKAAMITVATLFILQNLDVDVGSLLAGLGIGGLAVAFAAKDTLANFFGSLMIFVDRPFQIGDWVQVTGAEGTIEEVGFRSTRIRTFYHSLVTVPNSKVADALIDNMGERKYRRFKTTLGISYGASPEQIQAFVEGIRAILHSNPSIWYEGSQVHFYNYGASSLEILLYTHLDVPDWSAELKVRHHILLDISRLAHAIGVSFAFPTQSIHIESTPESPPKNHTHHSPETLAKIIKSFGPEGEHGLSDGFSITEEFGAGQVVARGDSDAGE